MTPDRALEYFFEAAKKGNMTAKGYFKRLFDALSNPHSTDQHLRMKGYSDTWLLEAAAVGHQTAFDDYTKEGADRSKKKMVIDLQASSLFAPHAELPSLDAFQKEVELLSRGQKSSLSYDNSAIHWAAYKDLSEHIRILVSDLEFDANLQMTKGRLH